MSNLQYLSQTNLAMIGRDIQLLSHNQLINNINELADGLHDLIALVSQINTKTAVNNYVIPNLTPAYQISDRTLRLNKVYYLPEALKVIHENINQSEDLKRINDIINILTKAEDYYRSHPGVIIDARYDNLLENTLPITPYRGVKLPDNVNIFNQIEPDFGPTYTDRYVAITNLNHGTNGMTAKELAKQHNVNEKIIRDFCHFIGLTKDDIVVDNDQLLLTDRFEKQLSKYLK